MEIDIAMVADAAFVLLLVTPLTTKLFIPSLDFAVDIVNFLIIVFIVIFIVIFDPAEFLLNVVLFVVVE